MMAGKIPLFERFQRFLVIPDDPDACWGWSGALDEKGYGRIGRGGRGAGVCIASRVSYERHIGPIPDGMWVLHSCDNPPCCNPRHLFLGDAVSNVADMDAKGRRVYVAAPRGDLNPARRFPERLRRGESLHLSKLTEDDVRAIRAEYATGTISTVALGAKYGVNNTTIGYIVRRVTWKHVA